MCNDYANRIPYDAYVKAFRQLKAPLSAPGGPPNLEPREDIWPTDVAPVIRADEDGVELVQLRDFRQHAPKDRRSSTCAQRTGASHGRCLVPMTHFYEFTGKRSPKDKWRFTKQGRTGSASPVCGGPSKVLPRPSRCSHASQERTLP
jgi:putative SOS response-associated peptidase YedK